MISCTSFVSDLDQLYAFSLFLPTIIAELGYTSTKAQLLSVPPYVAAAIVTITIGWIADRTHQRGLCNMIIAFSGITGYAMLLGSGKPGVQYAGTFLAAMGGKFIPHFNLTLILSFSTIVITTFDPPC